VASHGIDRVVDVVDALRVGARARRPHVLVWMIARAAGGFPGRAEDTPEQILKRRYARSKIDREEYDRRLTDIRR